MSGSLNMGTNTITNVGTINSVNITSHSSRHNPGGADAISTAVPNQIQAGISIAEGTATSLARSDHTHSIATAIVNSIGTVNSEGSSSSLARADHIHNHGTQSDGYHHALVTNTVHGFMSNVDKIKLDTVENGATNSPITSTAPSDVTKSSAVVGISTEAARADHKHNISTAIVGSITPGDSASEGTSTSLARADHIHSISGFGVPVKIGSSNSAGISNTFSRSDHVHDGYYQTILDSAASAVIQRHNLQLTGNGVVLTDNSGADKTIATITDTGATVASITKDPTGFPNRTDSIISRVDGTRTFTISPVGVSFDTYYHAQKITYSSAQSVTWSDVNGTWFFYFNSSGTLVSTQDVNLWIAALLGDGVMVASLYWDSATSKSIILSEERHGFMPTDVHLEMHEVFGTQWFSGGALTGILSDKNGSLDGYAEFAVGDVQFADEDIRFVVTNGSPQVLSPSAQIPVYYRSGASGTWKRMNPDSFPLAYSGKGGYTGANGRAAYNQNTGSTWQLTEIGENNFVISHIFATNDMDYPVICILGQDVYTTISDAHSGVRKEIIQISGTSELLSNELTPLGSVIYQSSSTFVNTPKATIRSTLNGSTYNDFRGTLYKNNAFIVTDHGDLTGLLTDDHTQYLLANGTRSMSGSLNMNTNNITNVGLINNWYDYGPSATDPTVPTPANGYKYYNTVIGCDMYYDAVRAKWLGCEKNVYSGAAGNTIVGAFFRGIDSLAFGTNIGIPVVKGTITGLMISMTTSVSAVVEILLDNTVITSINLTTAGLTTDLTINADFDQGLLKFRNKAIGSATMENVQINCIYKRRA